MLAWVDIPNWIRSETVEDGLHGDVDAFMDSYTSGEQSAAYSHSEALNALSNDRLLRCLIGSNLVPGCS